MKIIFVNLTPICGYLLSHKSFEILNSEVAINENKGQYIWPYEEFGDP